MIRHAAALALTLSAAAETPQTAEAIMARVAENQERSLAARSLYVYQQDLLIRMRRANGKLAREERSEFQILPGPKGFERKRVSFAGKYERDGNFHDYGRPRYNYKDVDIDGDIISDLADDLTGDNDARDGISKDLFPLTADEQSKYAFRLVGKEPYRGREAWRVKFSPRPHSDGAAWSGEALVDAAEYEPVLVNTRLAKGIPFWVKTLLGTNVKYLGFSVGYQRFDNGVWFPVSYGGEFEVKAVFFYKRLITLSLANTGFRRADVTSEIRYAGP